MTIEVKTFVGAAAAYACIRPVNKEFTMDVRLEPGRSASTSLRETAEEWRRKAEKYRQRAEILEDAAKVLDQPVR